MRKPIPDTLLRHVRSFADDLIAGLSWPGIFVLAIVLAATLAGGFLVGLRGFAVNLLAGVVGLIVAIVAGILFIDRLPDRRRERAWQQLHQHTLEMLELHIASFATCCALATNNNTIPNDLAHDSGSHSRTAAWLQQLASTIRATPHLDGATLERILATCEHDLAQITGTLTPTVISLSSDTTLIDHLHALTQSANRSLLLLQRQQALNPHRKTPNPPIPHAIAATIDAAAAVLNHLSP